VKHEYCVAGCTGSGKTYLACALGHQACRDGHRVVYYHDPKLFRELQTAQADGSLMKLLKKLARAALLLIDDFGVASVAGKQYRDLLEILNDRHGPGATLITSQFPVNQWHELINDATVADAILDRLVHNADDWESRFRSMLDAAADLLVACSYSGVHMGFFASMTSTGMLN
jgi:DNA replication protein DnaC